MNPLTCSHPSRLLSAGLLLLALCSSATHAADKKVLLVAGTPSHPPGAHEHNADIQLLHKCLAGVPGLRTEAIFNDGPLSAETLNGVDAIIINCDGEARHVALTHNHTALLEAAAARGVGIGFLHYAVEPSKDRGQPEFLRWVGGAFEQFRSVNPHWDAEFKSLPRHPVTRGVQPFTIRDEWYFNLRFVDGMKGVTPLLVAVPPASTMERPDGDHSGNPGVRAAVAKGEPQTLAWAFERADGGRGFGFTGGHFHSNWGDENFRKVVLNAVLWLAKMEVPPNGVASTVSASDLAMNLDPKPAPKPRTDAVPAKSDEKK